MQVGVTDSWYFLMVSTILITIIGTSVTEKIVEPRLGKYKGNVNEELTTISENEKRGLKFSGIELVIFLIVMGLTIIPGGVLRNPETGEFLKSIFMDSIVIIAIAFFVLGVAYGMGARKVKSNGIQNWRFKYKHNISTYELLCINSSFFREI